MLSIEEIRKKLIDMNLSSVARKCGISEQVLYRLMRGDDIRISAAEKISDYLMERETGDNHD